MSDVALNKKESIERCVKQIRRYYNQPSDVDFEHDHFTQDAIAINLQRVCEQCIDLANHLIKLEKLGLPKSSRESFRILADNMIISPEMSLNLERMVGFRNVLVHEYQVLDVKLMIDVIENHLDELIDFSTIILRKLIEK